MKSEMGVVSVVIRPHKLDGIRTFLFFWILLMIRWKLDWSSNKQRRKNEPITMLAPDRLSASCFRLRQPGFHWIINGIGNSVYHALRFWFSLDRNALSLELITTAALTPSLVNTKLKASQYDIRFSFFSGCSHCECDPRGFLSSCQLVAPHCKPHHDLIKEVTNCDARGMKCCRMTCDGPGTMCLPERAPSASEYADLGPRTCKEGYKCVKDPSRLKKKLRMHWLVPRLPMVDIYSYVNHVTEENKEWLISRLFQ